MDIDMKEKFTDLLAEGGLTVEMGVTPGKFTYVLNVEKNEETVDFWFVETEDGIDTLIPNFVKWNLNDYIFACIKDGDYKDGKYMVGKIDELKDSKNPEGIHEENGFMTMTFAQLLEALK